MAVLVGEEAGVWEKSAPEVADRASDRSSLVSSIGSSVPLWTIVRGRIVYRAIACHGDQAADRNPVREGLARSTCEEEAFRRRRSHLNAVSTERSFP